MRSQNGSLKITAKHIFHSLSSDALKRLLSSAMAFTTYKTELMRLTSLKVKIYFSYIHYNQFMGSFALMSRAAIISEVQY
jgi:hypothetical protein